MLDLKEHGNVNQEAQQPGQQQRGERGAVHLGQGSRQLRSFPCVQRESVNPSAERFENYDWRQVPESTIKGSMPTIDTSELYAINRLMVQ